MPKRTRTDLAFSLLCSLPSVRAHYLARPRPSRVQASTSSSTPPTPFYPAGLSLDSPFLGPSPSTELPPPVPRPLPAEFLRLEKALLALVSNLPLQYRDPSRTQLGGIPPWTRDIGLAADQGEFLSLLSRETSFRRVLTRLSFSSAGTYDAPSPLNVKIGINPVLFCLHVTLCTWVFVPLVS